jgi:hypothetical protein
MKYQYISFLIFVFGIFYAYILMDTTDNYEKSNNKNKNNNNNNNLYYNDEYYNKIYEILKY